MFPVDSSCLSLYRLCEASVWIFCSFLIRPKRGQHTAVISCAADVIFRGGNSSVALLPAIWTTYQIPPFLRPKSSVTFFPETISPRRHSDLIMGVDGEWRRNDSVPITKGGRWQVSKATLLSTLFFLIIYFRTPAVLLHWDLFLNNLFSVACHPCALQPIIPYVSKF